MVWAAVCPVKEAKVNWVTARRAILRSPIQRIGYGGYLKLALQLPDFVQYIEEVCQEFGGEYWCQEKIITAVKEFVYNGGGFIGVGEHAAHQWQGKFFQLDDVLGVEEGRSVYISGLPYSFKNSRILYRAVLWAASAEEKLNCCHFF